ncbi:hypothetical protein PPS11_14686 [Pseudomonas putida S11]|nr:hypothetical protein PPS11_14686 [Pseudomonas putida S11]
MLEQCTQETIVLQGSHVGIRKNSAGIFSDASAKGTVKAMRFVYWMPWIKGFLYNKNAVGAALQPVATQGRSYRKYAIPV